MSVQVHDRVVRLSMAEFETLVADTLPEAERRPVLDVPGMAEALAGVRDPLLVLQVDLAVASGGRTHFGWVGEDALALLLPVDQHTWQLMALPVDQLAASLARVVGLGPGARVRQEARQEARQLALNPFADFFSADAAIRAAALAAHGVDVAWTLGVRSGDEEWLMAAASGPDGSWLFLPASEMPAADDAQPDADDDNAMPMSAHPVTATELYRRFTAIAPGMLASA